MFVLTNPKEGIIINFPKYIIFPKNNHTYIFHDYSIFYYLVTSNINQTIIYNKFPVYLITFNLFFNGYHKNAKFNISKLGTDYIVNGIGSLYLDECKGSYPDNYVFVKKPKRSYISEK